MPASSRMPPITATAPVAAVTSSGCRAAYSRTASRTVSSPLGTTDFPSDGVTIIPVSSSPYDVTRSGCRAAYHAT